MGFREVGRHISKDVTLYRQCDINLVVNTEREGFAHSSYLVHGTSVRAIGLRVEDAAATVRRVRALCAEPFEQAAGLGELTSPAIRSVGGGVVYFIDGRLELAKVWDMDFTPTADPEASRDAGLTGIDHIGQTMDYEEMLTWLLFYTAIFRTRKAPMVDFIEEVQAMPRV